MATERSRNTLVGITVLAALALALIGISSMGYLPKLFKPKPYLLRIDAATAAGILPGAKVNFGGVQVGTVKEVRLVTNATATGSKVVQTPPPGNATPASPLPLPSVYAEIVVAVDRHHDLPRGTMAAVGTQGISFGGATVSLLAPAVATTEILAKDDTAVIQAGPTDSGLIPKEITIGFVDLQREITDVARKLNVLLESDPAILAKYPPDDPRRKTVAQVIASAHDTLAEVKNTVAGLNTVVADKDFQANVRTVAKNLAEQTTRLREVLDTIQKMAASAEGTIGKVGTAAEGTLAKVGTAADDIGKAARSATTTLDTAQVRIIASTDKLATTLKQLDDTMKAITAGEGTTGKLVKDPRLYDGLVDLTRSLQATTEELNKLVHQWKNDGVPLKVGFGKN